MNSKRKRGGQPGHLVSEEARRKISEAKLGKSCSSRTKFKVGEHASPATEFKLGQSYNARAPEYTFVASSGYRMIRDPEYPKRWRRQHTVIAEKALGRRLKAGEEIHHINGDKLDNRNENLLICSTAYHRELERHMAYLYQREHFA